MNQRFSSGSIPLWVKLTDYWLPFRLTQCGHELANLPAIVCTETTLFYHKGHWGVRFSQQSPAMTRAMSLMVLLLFSSTPHAQASFHLSFLRSYISILCLFICTCILFFPAWTHTCPDKHLTFVWQCFLSWCRHMLRPCPFTSHFISPHVCLYLA